MKDWVRENCERVQQLRDKASANYRETSQAMKQKKDSTYHFREFSVGQSVWYRTPGLSDALQPSQQSPYRIEKLLGPLSYRLDVDGKPRNIHAKFLKENTVKVINRVTTMLEDDKEKDDVMVTNDKLHIEGVVVDDAKQKDIDAWTSEFGDVIRQEPGLTDLVELSIDTGGHHLSLNALITPLCLYVKKLATRLIGSLTKDILGRQTVTGPLPLSLSKSPMVPFVFALTT